MPLIQEVKRMANQQNGKRPEKNNETRPSSSFWVVIAAIVLVILFVLLGILIPIMVISGIIIYLVRFRPRQ